MSDTFPQSAPRQPAQPTARFVLHELRRRIVTGELTPSARIVERRLCDDLNVSRTPLREALKLLEIDGLVELSQHRGATVRPLLIEEAGELFDVLAVLEGHAARRTAMLASEGEIAKLQLIHQEMEKHFSDRDRGRYFRLNTAIHHRVVALANSVVLIDSHRTLALRAERYRYHAIAQEARWKAALAEHADLMDALVRGDADAAGVIWQDHTIKTGAALMESLEGAHQPSA